MTRIRRFVLPRWLVGWTCLLLFLPTLAIATSRLDRGTLEGAHFIIAVPTNTKWNGHVLLIAHGYRPESAPLVADLFPQQTAYCTLLESGWIVAKTSYRRNGIIVADAIDDLDNLHDHIVDTYGTPRVVIVKGDSMGGTIATLLAERQDTRYDGLIAIGAALDLREPDGASGVTLQPIRPLLFMSNRSEFEGPRNYLVNAVSNTPGFERPALFRIDRDGHVNVNQAERLHAVRAMVAWLADGRSALPPFTESRHGTRYHDATQPPSPGPSRVTFDDDQRGLTAEITEISAIYGNAWLNLQPDDMDRIGLTSGLWARLLIGDREYRVRRGTDFDSVERGQWVIFPNADGFCWLSRNWANAAETADLKIGDTVRLRRYDSAD